MVVVPCLLSTAESNNTSRIPVHIISVFTVGITNWLYVSHINPVMQRVLGDLLVVVKFVFDP